MRKIKFNDKQALKRDKINIKISILNFKMIKTTITPK